MRLDHSMRRTGGVTLVAVRATNTAERPLRARVANRLDGQVWPPRAGGHPAPGWDDGGYEAVFGAGETRAFGYATPGPPSDPPVEVAWTERAPAVTPADAPAEIPPGVLVARFGDPRPPRDALPDPASEPAIPLAVAEWLDAVRERARNGEELAADRATLDAVIARAADIRRWWE